MQKYNFAFIQNNFDRLKTICDLNSIYENPKLYWFVLLMV
jgi:hypothetical protein